MRHIRGQYVDRPTLVRLLQMTSAPVLRAAQRAGDAAVECHELVRKLPCMQLGYQKGCSISDVPVYLPVSTGAPPKSRFGLQLAIMMLVGLIGVVIGGYLTRSIQEQQRNQPNVSDPIRDCV